MSEFVHLHVHTQYSLLDGALKISDLMKRVKEHGMSAVAMTDHGNMYGAVDFQKSAKKNGIKPIIGCELYVTKEPYDAEKKTEPKSYHLTVLAKDLTGYKNLMELNSMGWLNGLHPRTGVPRVDFDVISQYTEGLIVLSGDLGGEINQAILRGTMDEARAIAIKYRDLFGPDHYYLEVMRNALPEQERCTQALVELGKELGIGIVATNDCHYLNREDARAHAILMSIQLGKTVDLDRLMEHGLDQLYVRSPAEMIELFEDLPEAIENTVKIAERCNVEIPLGQVFLPKYKVPDEFIQAHGITDIDQAIHAYFAHVAKEGLEARFNEFRELKLEFDEQVYRDRLDLEIGVIQQMDFPGYFLIVWDFINWAKEQGIPVGPGRGSGAGSLVAYTMRITNLDPLPYDLLFERFLNPERVSMPDFDIDFCMNRRGEVIQYVTQKYGEHNVGQIITYGQLKAKAVVKDVGRALGVSYGEMDRIAKLVPDVLGITLQQALDQEPRLQALRQESETLNTLFEIALSLENLNRQAGMHAAGVVISEEPLWKYVPICRGANGELVTQFAKNEVEEAGLVKFDFLGLKTLTVITTAVDVINIQRKLKGLEPFDIEKIPLDDPSIYKLISSGDTTGVFQLESSGFQELLKKLKPDCFEDIVAAVALYRPGPLGSGMVDDFIDCKHGRKRVEYPHPWLEETLKPTYGVMVYQEQVMQTARVMAGYSLGGADVLRRCLSAETLVMRADTGQRIRVDQVEPGTPIWTLDERLKLVKVEVAELIDNGVEETFKLITKSGRQLRLTSQHPLLTVQGWRHLCDLKVGDAIAAPKVLPTFGTMEVDPARAKILAYLLGDGQTVTSKGKTLARFYNTDPELLDDYSECVLALGGQVKRYNVNGVTVVTCHGQGGGNPVLKLVRAAQINHSALDKTIPAEVFVYDKDSLRLFIGALWSTDGSIERKRISYSSSSERLIEDLAHLLLRFGVVTMRRCKQTKRAPNYELLITDQEDVIRFAEAFIGMLCSRKDKRLAFLSAQAHERQRNQSVYDIPADILKGVAQAKAQSGLSWREAGHRVNVPGNCLSAGLNFKSPNRALSRHRLDLLARAFDGELLSAHAHSDLIWDPIVSIEPAGSSRVYDLAVPPFANFVAQDIVVHNSMGKKKPEVMAQQKGIFVDGAKGLGIDESKSGEIFDLMAYFAGYGFNKSHSAAYALITYQTAYLKTHYKVEFMAALMTNDRDNTDKVVRFINEAKGMGISVLPPDVNESQLDFSVTDGKIRFGLAAIKGVGAGVIEHVIEVRQSGPFKSLYDFCSRIDLKKINKRTIEALVKCGAFDAVGPASDSKYMGDHCDARARMVEAIPLAAERGQKAQHDRAVGQSSLFGMLAPSVQEDVLEDTYPECEPWSEKELLAFERQLIGFYVTGHPLDRFEDEISIYGVTSAADVTSCRGLQYREDVTIAGVVSEYRERPLKNGTGRMAFVTIEDKSGGVEAIVFSSAYDACEAALKSNEPVLLSGQYTEDGDLESRIGKVRASEAIRLSEARRRYVRKVNVEVEADELSAADMVRLKEIFEQFPGTCKTSLVIGLTHDIGRGKAELQLPDSFRVEPCDELLTQVERLFRRKAVRLSSG